MRATAADGLADGSPVAGRGRRRAKDRLSALANAMRQDLADGAYSPRERLVEADLVTRYGAARTAVREVLIQLSSEGLLERAPNRGARVRGMSLGEAIEIAEVRRLLEPLAAERAAQRATPSERAGLLELAGSLRDAAAAGDVGTYLRLNARFHVTIHAAARHATVQAILERFRHRPIDRFLPEPFRATPPMASVDAHLRIASAIAAGDASAARAAMDEHMTELIDLLDRFARGSAPTS